MNMSIIRLRPENRDKGAYKNTGNTLLRESSFAYVVCTLQIPPFLILIRDAEK